MKYKCCRLLLGLMLSLLLAGCSGEPEATYELSLETPETAAAESVPDPAADTGVPEQAEEIVVYICGAVADPGVYTLPAGSRAFAAVDAAGGFLPEAAEEYLNLAQELSDGQQIIVYTDEEVKAGAAGASDSPEGKGSGRINLNRADKEQLMKLPGIGETRAEAILEYRQAHGSFASVEEIQKVSGIKEKLFEKIKDYIEI